VLGTLQFTLSTHSDSRNNSNTYINTNTSLVNLILNYLNI